LQLSCDSSQISLIKKKKKKRSKEERKIHYTDVKEEKETETEIEIETEREETYIQAKRERGGDNINDFLNGKRKELKGRR